MTRPDGRRIGIIPLRGTWETQREAYEREHGKGPTRWFRPGSLFHDLMSRDYGIELVDFDRDPATPNLPLWSGALQGTLAQGWFARLTRSCDPDWKNGGERYRRLLLEHAPHYDILLTVAFSHGGQAMAYGLAMQPPTRVLLGKLATVTVDTPIRSDQASFYERAANRLIDMADPYDGPGAPMRAWVHLCTSGVRTWVRWAGARSFRRNHMKHAARNIEVPGHGVALYEPRKHARVWRVALATLGIDPLPYSASADISV